MKNLKYIMLSVATIGQIVGIIFLFINFKIAIGFYLCYLLALVILFWLLIRERVKEKKEDEENDYRNY